MIDLITAILGDITVCGETYHDKEVYENLDNYDEILDYILGKIFNCASWKGDQRFSMDECGKKAYILLQDAYERIGEFLHGEDENG